MTSLSHPPLTLLTSREYIQDLTLSVTRAKNRINIMSLILTSDSATRPLIKALVGASKRGVKISVAVDSFTYSELGGFFSPLKHIKIKSRATSAMVKQLRRAGIEFTWLGASFKFNPFAGLTHLKWSIVDNIAYGFGGTNLYKDGIESVDYMFKSHSPQLADQITRQHQAIITNDTPHTYPGYISKSEYGTIYIDSGQRHKSIIYDRLMKLTKQAVRIRVVTQYCPSGPLARRLRQRKAEVYFNQARNTSFPTNMLIGYTERYTGLRSLYKHEAYLHAKFMLFDLADGQKIAVTGSHNFAHSGVVFGTREVALETSHPDIYTQLETFLSDHVIKN